MWTFQKSAWLAALKSWIMVLLSTGYACSSLTFLFCSRMLRTQNLDTESWIRFQCACNSCFMDPSRSLNAIFIQQLLQDKGTVTLNTLESMFFRFSRCLSNPSKSGDSAFGAGIGMLMNAHTTCKIRCFEGACPNCRLPGAALGTTNCSAKPLSWLVTEVPLKWSVNDHPDKIIRRFPWECAGICSFWGPDEKLTCYLLYII